MKEVVMTEAGMSPERQGWFAGLKEKVRKSFTIQGSKEKFYQNNADLIAKATANLTPEDKQTAYAQIEQDALSSAKIDVATHWGALVLGTTVAGLGGALMSDKIRGRVGEMGAAGKKLAGFGDKAKDGLMRMVGKFNLRFEGRGSAIPFKKDIAQAEKQLEAALLNKKMGAKQVEALKKNLAALRKAAEADKLGRVTAQVDKFSEKIAAERQNVTDAARLAREVATKAKTNIAGLEKEKDTVAWALDQLKKRAKK